MMDKNKFLTVETHAHTADISTCSDLSARELVHEYIKCGYDALCVTNHLDLNFLARTPLRGSALAAAFFRGYEAVREEGERHGLIVLPGIELRLTATNDDILVYGIDEAALAQMGSLPEMTLEAASRSIHEAGGLLYQAHPFRDQMTRLDVRFLDGIEVNNAHITHQSRNPEALAWATQNQMRQIGGSDAHLIAGCCVSGVFAPRKAVASAQAFALWLRNTPHPEIIRKQLSQ